MRNVYTEKFFAYLRLNIVIFNNTDKKVINILYGL